MLESKHYIFAHVESHFFKCLPLKNFSDNSNHNRYIFYFLHVKYFITDITDVKMKKLTSCPRLSQTLYISKFQFSRANIESRVFYPLQKVRNSLLSPTFGSSVKYTQIIVR